MSFSEAGALVLRATYVPPFVAGSPIVSPPADISTEAVVLAVMKQDTILSLKNVDLQRKSFGKLSVLKAVFSVLNNAL